MVCRLRIVHAKAVEQHQGLRKAPTLKHDVRLPTAGATLLDEDRRVLPQHIERRLGSKLHGLERQHDYGPRRLSERNESGGAEHNHGF